MRAKGELQSICMRGHCIVHTESISKYKYTWNAPQANCWGYMPLMSTCLLYQYVDSNCECLSA